jgi:hypothetical protein
MRDLGEVLLYIFAGYGWFKIVERLWNFFKRGKIWGHPERVLFLQMCLLVIMLFLGIVTIYYLATTRRER